MRKKDSKKKDIVVKVSTLNLAVLLMTAAFIIGTYGSIMSIPYSTECGFFCRLNNVMTGNVVVEGTSSRGITCYVTGNSACGVGKVKLFAISDKANGHAALIENIGDYPWVICCEGTGLNRVKDITIDPTAVKLLNLSGQADAHAEVQGSYAYSIKAKMNNLECAYLEDNARAYPGTSICTENGYDTCVAALSSLTNAHVADCTSTIYPVKICCKAPILPSCPVNQEYNASMICSSGKDVSTDKYDTSKLSAGITKCCDGTVYDLYNPALSICPQDKQRAVIGPAGASIIYCEKGSITSILCGNSVIDTGEECDGTNLAGHTCEEKSMISGTLKCINCKLDTSECRTGAPAPETTKACGNYDTGQRDATSYCPAGGIAGETEMITQKIAGDTCSNDYECVSNFCQDGKCTSLKSTLDLIPRIWCLLSAWISNPTDKEIRTLNACDCMCGFFNNDENHPYIAADCSEGFTCPSIS
jgi:hypothetical protein